MQENKDKIFASIKKRIIDYISIKGVTKESFYKESGLSASNFKGKGAESELGGEKIAKILSLYDDLSAEWLLTGKGKMLKEETEQPTSDINKDALERIRGLSAENALLRKELDDIQRAKKIGKVTEMLLVEK